METIGKAVVYGVVGFAVVAIIAALLGVVTMFLWNAVIPQIFGLPSISLMQGVLLNILCSVLFKSHSSSSK